VNVHEIFKGKIGPLPVRVRSTFDADGAGSAHSTVHCPYHERSMSLKACALCEHFGGVDDRDGEPLLLCHRPSIEVPTKLAASAETCAATTPVSKVMKSVTCVASSVDVDDAAKLLLELGAQAVPVVDGEGRLEGIVSKTDLVRHGHVNAGAKATVAEVMTRHPLAIRETVSIADAVTILLRENIHQLPVVGASGEVLAMVTPRCVLEWVGASVPGGCP
jgi:CBS domain-containing protein